jgi:putative membrane protein
MPGDDPRVFFAAERTLLAWIRTGLALMGLGFVMARFALVLRELTGIEAALTPDMPGASRWFGIALVALGAVTTAGATVIHVMTVRRLRGPEPWEGRPSWLAVGLAGFIVAIGAALAAYLMVSI